MLKEQGTSASTDEYRDLQSAALARTSDTNLGWDTYDVPKGMAR